MKVVFANSAYVTARERLIIAGGSFAPVRLNVRYGVVLHPEFGPILIDTGYTSHAMTAKRRSRALRLYSAILNPELRPEGQPEAVLSQLGFTPHDVKFVVVTHFHADHVSGLAMFPNAQFIVDGPAWATVQSSSWQNLRHGVFAELLPPDFAARASLLSDCSQTPDGADILGDGSMIAIPLPGHADGHYGVLIGTDPTPVFYAVDAQWLMAAVVEDRTPRFPARLIMDDPKAMQKSTAVVARHIAQGHDVVLCHDPAATPYDLPPSDAS